MADHLGSCLACQAELAGYRRLLRVLRSMRDEPVTVPSPELIGRDLDGSRRSGLSTAGGAWPHRDRRERWLVAGALVMIGLAALGVGAVVARTGPLRAARRGVVVLGGP